MIAALTVRRLEIYFIFYFFNCKIKEMAKKLRAEFGEGKKEKVRLLTREGKLGLGSAYAYGLRYAR